MPREALANFFKVCTFKLQNKAFFQRRRVDAGIMNQRVLWVHM